jgi:hypothetical protein
MTKSISAQLLTDLQNGVTTTAVCIEIVRRDGKTFRITNHDVDVTFEGQVYTHTVPFALGAIDSGSQLATDNVPLTLYADGVIFEASTFDNGLYDYAECTIFFVDYENPSHGKMTVRRGWFGQIERNRRNVINITVTGLLKVLDFEVGRVYQPTCDADLGDSRCKIAINHSQAYSIRNAYRAGDWVYYYDEALMNALTVVNPGFEADGVRNKGQAITGWTRGAGAALFVNTSPHDPGVGGISLFPVPDEGSYALYCGFDTTDNDSGFESYIYQDIDLVSDGLDALDIDDGKISVLYQVALSQNIYTLDPLKLKLELIDGNNEVISVFDSGWIFLDTFDEWRERAVYAPLYPTTRYLRISIYMRKEDGAVANCGADDVRLWYWDHTLGTPYEDVIHKLSRMVTYGEAALSTPKNPSFEANGAVANALSPTIANWTTTGSWWQIDNNVGPLSPSHGTFALVGGDDGGATQQTYTASQNFTLASIVTLDSARLTLGKYVGRFSLTAFFADAGLTKASVQVAFYDVASTLLLTINALSNEAPGGIGIQTLNKGFALPYNTHSITVTLQVHTPVGDGDGSKVGFDSVRFFFFDAERPVSADPIAADGSASTVWETAAGDYTVDQQLIWKALGTHVGFDVVDSVVSRKEFVATAMAGADGTYETGYVWWISGDNAGLKTPIRTWDGDTSTVKLYFKEPFDIQVGDRFIFVRSCQRRFVEDCVATFQNGINFRGFPHLPGKLTEEEVADETA